MFVRVSERFAPPARADFKVGFKVPPWSAWRGRLVLLLKSCAIGSFIGALPGTGAATSAFISYSEAKRSSPNRENIGKGEPDGIIAAESANNAVTGSALVPTLALGIPGDPVTAVMLGTLLVQGITPGPRLFAEHLDIVYAIFFILIDIELMFVWPWAVIYRRLGWFGFVEMMVFLGILTIGFVYEWRKGALEWE